MSWAAKVSTPGYTPGRRDFPELVIALNNASEEDEKALELALVRAKDLAVSSIAANANKLGVQAAIRACRVLGAVGGHQAVEQLLKWAKRDEEKLKQQAFIALGKVGDRSIEPALIEAWATTMADGVRRSLVEAMGKVGGQASLEAISDLVTDHEVLQAAASRALLMLRRTGSRTERIAPVAKQAVSAKVIAMCRRGLERLLAEELRAIEGITDVATHDLAVHCSLNASPEVLTKSRLWEHVEFELHDGGLDGPLADAIVKILDTSHARDLARAFGHEELRFRLAIETGGQRRADIWAIAEATSKLKGIINDSKLAPFVLHISDAVGPKGASLKVTLEARDFGGARFSYRERDVPAASHPTIAAALVRAGGTQNSDVVWDPFCGSGLELCERVLAGPYRRIVGSDIDERSLTAARANLAALEMEVPAELVVAEALKWSPPNVTLIITNPPMGRRVTRDGSIGQLLEAFVSRAASVLRPGGRLVWLNPMPRATEAAIAQSGMQRVRVAVVDMGGFDAELQVLHKPGSRVRPQRNRRET